MKKFFYVQKLGFLIMLFTSGAICGAEPLDNSSVNDLSSSSKYFTGGDSAFIYKSCKESLEKNSFGDSHCRTAIMGFMSGVSFLMMGIFLPNAIPEDPYKKGEYDTVQRLSQRLCLPKNIDLKMIAKSYVEWYERRYADHNFSDISEYSGEFSLVASVFSNFECKPMKGESK